MHRIDDAIAHGGRRVLSDLPFAEGQHVRIVVAEIDAKAPTRTIQKYAHFFQTVLNDLTSRLSR